MNRTSTLIFISLSIFSEMSFSCSNEQGEFLELSIDSSQYTTKPDKSKPNKPSFFNKGGMPPSLFCSSSSGSKCDENGIWVSAEDFARYLVGYKPVHCFQQKYTLKVKSGVETRESRFVVYYTDN